MAKMNTSSEAVISVIKEMVANAANLSVQDLEIPNGTPTSRKREKVAARSVSMYFMKQYTRLSLQQIGELHGGRDHATVLYGIKETEKFVNMADPLVFPTYLLSKKNLEKWCNMYMSKRKKKDEPTGLQIPIRIKMKMLRNFIEEKIPLEQRQYILQHHNRNKTQKELKNGNNIKTISAKLQRSNKIKI